ncbi:MAG: GTPase HflX [Planctomycetes bacterium]|nr:GTPase HflX [Planctomycetota bacterium]
MQQDKFTVHRERAALVRLLLPSDKVDGLDPLEELAQLAHTAGAIVEDRILQNRPKPDPSFFVGRGKAEELADLVRVKDLDVIIFDHPLSPAQVRNVEKLVNAKVLDRTELILDIFATHAKTRQAKLQVELAQLEYTLPRLKHMWTHLERYAGGVGIGTRGPGEQQIEVDRRIARRRITDLKADLAQIEARKRREVDARADNFTVSLVGYTNAGKSTLMNTLTRAGVLVENRLFSTLDTKTHIWRLASGAKALLSDTVGFIRNLPHDLVASFHATLEEVTQADLLLHVVDSSSPEALTQIAAVEAVLKELGCDGRPVVMVLNKADAVDDPVEFQILRNKFPTAVAISALAGSGMAQLEARVESVMSARMAETTIDVPAADGRTQAYLAAHGHVLAREIAGENIRLRVRISARDLARLPKNGAGGAAGAGVKVRTRRVRKAD